MELDITEMVDGVEKVKKITKQATVTTRENASAIEKAFSSVGRVMKVSEDKALTAKHAVTQHARAINTAQRQLDSYTNQIELLSQLTGKSAIDQEILTRQFQLGKGATDSQKAAIADLVRKEHELVQANTKVKGSFRAMRNSTSQLQYQLQDIAVQAQMGTNAFVILGQQGSQIASLFGTGGAVVGSIIAVGAALSGILIKAIMGTSGHVKEFKTDVKSLAENLDGLSKLKPAQLQQTLLDVIQMSKELGVEAESNAGKIANLQQVLKQGFEIKSRGQREVEVGLTPADIKAKNRELIALQALQELITSELEKQRTLGSEISAISVFRTKGQTFGEAKKVYEVVKALQVEAAQYGLSERELALLNAEKAKADDVQKAYINGIYDEIEAKKKQKKANDELKQKNESSQKYIDSLGYEVHMLKLNDEQKLEYIAATKATTKVQYDEILSLLKLSKARKEDIENIEARKKLMSELTDEGRVAALTVQYEKERALLAGHNAELAKLDENFNRERIKINGTFWEKYQIAAQESLMSFDDQVSSSLDNFTAGFGDAFATAIFESDSLGSAMENLFKSAGKSMVSFFGEWTAQKMLLWALDETIGKATQTSAATTTAANAEANSLLASINAYQSAAAIPYTGWILAPAAAAAAAAATQPLAAAAASAAFAGVMDKGGNIPSGSSAIVSEIGDELVGGTMVYNGSPNSLKVTGREDTARKTGGGNTSININSYGNASPESIARAVTRLIKKGQKKLDTAIFDSMNRGRQNRGKNFA